MTLRLKPILYFISLTHLAGAEAVGAVHVGFKLLFQRGGWLDGWLDGSKVYKSKLSPGAELTLEKIKIEILNNFICAQPWAHNL